VPLHLLRQHPQPFISARIIRGAVSPSKFREFAEPIPRLSSLSRQLFVDSHTCDAYPECGINDNPTDELTLSEKYRPGLTNCFSVKAIA
jgi:hypothetical protein